MISTFIQLNPLQLTFYSAALLAIVASLKVITGKNTVHALLYLVVSLLAVAVCFYLMGAPFAAGLEVIVYAGAILILFVFAIMMFGLGQDETLHAPNIDGSKVNKFNLWFGPFLLALLLLIELVYAINSGEVQAKLTSNTIDAKQVGMLLYGPYLLAVEIASFLLLAGLIGGYHFAKPEGVGLDRKKDLGEHG
ncbi:NADH-quinone oxidoreductase subunit J [Candidatus Colwellia aromaticivorans]|uniref:NADH-quinone oxidoreductase subunit J n=1 Tax=Candidatus Colwellia aromaticivorans TaxID=2267621 RepID=UPI001FE342F8|nr:NADH-quinone oxidoreductase subunit J [Candidatus Colwellia aromaticivorans]